MGCQVLYPWNVQDVSYFFWGLRKERTGPPTEMFSEFKMEIELEKDLENGVETTLTKQSNFRANFICLSREI